MRVVITEKPSVARDLARVLGASTNRREWLEGQGLRITWCLGHLLELSEPDEYDPSWRRWAMENMPIIPDKFRIRPRSGDQDALGRLQVIRDLVQDKGTTQVINACDAGREGELIFRWVLEWCGAQKPVRRLWLASLTDSAIQAAWGSMRDGHVYDGLADAARCRAESDWLVGINATRSMTCLARRSGGGRLLSLGRVQTPTLAMIVARDAEIQAFVPEPTWQVKGTFEAEVQGEVGRWVGTWFASQAARSEPEKKKGEESADDEKEAPPAERLPSRAVAEALVQAVAGRRGRVEAADTRRQVDRPPPLYDLTGLQRRANQRYGKTATRTLEVAQVLYERGLITYPRTDSRHLTPDQVPGLPDLADAVGAVPVYRPFADVVIARFAQGWRPDRRVVDAAEVADHHAILPTGKSPVAFSLNVEEKQIYDLVARRFLAALSPDALFDRTTLIVAVPDVRVEGLEDPARFRARGRITVDLGWRAVDPPGPSRDVDLPRVHQGQPADVVGAEVVEGATRPPRPFDDASLLLAMETAGKDLDDAELRRIMRGAGLGTPATRAPTIDVLEKRRFIERRAKEIRATGLGSALINSLPATELKSAELTGQWERRLAAVQRGEEARDHFMADIQAHVGALVDRFRSANLPANAAFAAEAEGGTAIGPCPRCGAAVVERGPRYACTGCDFGIFKLVSGREVSRRAATALLQRGQTEPMKGFKSKRTGKAFSAGLRIGAEGKVELYFPEGEALGDCPRCGEGSVRDKGKVWACDHEGCTLVIFKEMSRRPWTADEARRLLKEGRIPGMEGFISKEGRPFRADVALVDGRARFEFGEERPSVPEAPTRPAPPPDAPADPTGQVCPECGLGTLMRGRSGWGCSRWRDGCTYVIRDS